jgi:diaminopimelate epimerase
VSRIGFVKAHACGNDFLIIEESAAGKKHAAIARRLCARNTGIGADGIEFLDRRTNGSLFLRLFNADGSEAELSGNGTRCVAAWLAASEGREQVALGTHGGVRSCRVVRREVPAEGSGPAWLIESAMGVPRVMRRAIEIDGAQGEGVKIKVEGAMVNVGNPHFVIFTEREDFGWQGTGGGMSWQELGAKISVDPLFRFGTNVEFVRVLAQDEIAFRIYERGCGPTTSSGTGTCASSAAAMALRGVARELTAVAEGGAQQVVWPDDASEMMLTGPAEIICQGEAEFAE